jgi:hypothetical protein
MRSRLDDPLSASVVSWRTRLRLLPWTTRVLVLVLLACAAAPAAAGLYAAFGGTALAAALRAHGVALPFIALFVASAAVVVFERPRSVSPTGYAGQLRDRLLEVQLSFGGALRRREGKGKEKSHAAPHSFDPNG